MSMRFEEVKAHWAKVANELVTWSNPWQEVVNGDFKSSALQWFRGGELNLSVNCLDRHLPYKANQVALFWEGDEPHHQRALSFAKLHHEVCLMANVLKELGITKSERVGIYLPMIPEAAIAMLACARIGAVHTVVFAGFSATALAQRLVHADCRLLITADGYQRGGKYFHLKQKADEATADLNIKQLIIRHNNNPVGFDYQRHFWWHKLKETVSADCPPEPMQAEDPLFILYTSGSTGQPKGLVHSTGGYLVQTAYTHQQVFQCENHEVFWCTADIGWITGHSYTIYGPLCNGISTLLYAGIPNWPEPSRIWKIVDQYKVNVLYTAPTAIRALKRVGDEWLTTSRRDSLRIIGSVGEPINPEVWRWYYQAVGKGRCPVVDTWWQTETGAIMISPHQGAMVQKPGFAGQAITGIVPCLLDEDGNEITGAGKGKLAIKYPWPAMARTILGDHERYLSSYFAKGYYMTGDGASRDSEGDYCITGRIDDVLNVSGHRIGSAEIESALVSHPLVAEAAVIGIPDELKGESISAHVQLTGRAMANPAALASELKQLVADQISPIARPDEIHFAADLPKTRSGKIMRRLLKKIATAERPESCDFGDLSTLANPEVLAQLAKTVGKLIT